ncbi:MAG: hypothetical protein MUD13_01580 [Candidatus Nanopelagicales bacterium]|jgi:DNA-binding SARP family transcriptional activator|nr:hypothetical protein [Candidatus Nanopelagicales bacterium]
MDEDRVGAPATRRGAELRMLDGFELRRDDRPIEIPPRARTLVALLGLTGGGSRSVTAGTLSPESTEAHAMGRLRSCLWRLHRCWPGLVVSTMGRLSLTPDLWVDTPAYARQLRRMCDTSAPMGVDDVAMAYTPVCELLPGWDEPWVVTEREHLRLLHVRALEALSAKLLAQGRNDLAMEAAHAAAASDPLRETAHQAVVAVHRADGNELMARLAERRFREALQRELGM